MSLIMRKPESGVCFHVRLKPAALAAKCDNGIEPVDYKMYRAISISWNEEND